MIVIIIIIIIFIFHCHCFLHNDLLLIAYSIKKYMLILMIFQFPKCRIPKHTNQSPSICPSRRNNLPPCVPGKSNHNPTLDSMLSLPASSDLIPFLNCVTISLFKPVYPSVHMHLERLHSCLHDKSEIQYQLFFKAKLSI